MYGGDGETESIYEGWTRTEIGEIGCYDVGTIGADDTALGRAKSLAYLFYSSSSMLLLLRL